MAYWFGAAFILWSGWLLFEAFQHRKKVIAARAKAAAAGVEMPKMHASLEIMAEVAPFFINIFLVAAGAMVTMTFFAVQATRWLSYFDLVGFLCLLGAYALWLHTHTSYRMIEETPAR